MAGELLDFDLFMTELAANEEAVEGLEKKRRGRSNERSPDACQPLVVQRTLDGLVGKVVDDAGPAEYMQSFSGRRGHGLQ